MWKMAQMSSTGGGFKSYVSLTSRPQLWSYCTLIPLTFYSHFFCKRPSCLTQALAHFQPSCNLIAPYLGLVKALGFIWAHWFPMFTAGFLQCEQQTPWRSYAERTVLWKKWPILLFPSQGRCLLKCDKWKLLKCFRMIRRYSHYTPKNDNSATIYSQVCCPKPEFMFVCMYVFFLWNSKGENLNNLHAAIVQVITV